MEVSIQNKAIRPLLKRIGLDEREIEVYLALLSMKTARAAQIAKASKQSRSHTYLILEDLKEKGLVSEIERGSVMHFVAEPPERLLSYLKNREQELRSLESLVEGAVPFLSSLTPKLVGQPRVTVLHGLEGIKHVYRDVFTQKFVAFFNPKVDLDAFGGNITTILLGENPQLHGKDLLVDNEAARKHIAEVPQSPEYEIRLLPKHITFEADIIIFENEIVLFTFADEPTIIRIENPQLADAFRALHKVFWEMSKKPSHAS